MNKISKAYKILNKINIGWNLGNYLDTHDKEYQIKTTNNKTVDEVISLWGNPCFNLKCFDELKNYGINCVRIPVTWCNFITISNKNLSISQEVISHLKNIIDYAFSKDFIIILDMHHDDQTWLNIATPNKEFKQVKNQYKKIWKQIAFEFKDYNENLIFEGMNEIIDRTNPQKFDWWGHNILHFKRLNNLYTLFIKTVRKHSKENKMRTLILSTYGAQIHHNALKHFKMVKDKNTIVDLHHYSKEKNITYFEETFNPTFEYLINKHIPVFMGEIGTKKEFANDFNYLANYMNYLNAHNIKYALWDNGSSRTYINRKTAKINHPELKNLLKKRP